MSQDKNSLKFHISTDICQQLIDSSRENKNRNNSRYLAGNYFAEFKRQINAKEKNSTDFTVTNAIVYPTKTKSLTSFLTITAFCKRCKKIDNKNGRYNIEIKESPFNNINSEEDQEFALVNVTTPTHLHTAATIESPSVDTNSSDTNPSDTNSSDTNPSDTNPSETNSIQRKTKCNEDDDDDLNANSRWANIKSDQLRGEERDRVSSNNFYYG
jgi:hypothetical protein